MTMRRSSAAEFFLDGLPGQPPETLGTLFQFAGHLPSHPTTARSPPPDANLWFWLIRASHLATTQRLVIWFNGGPGCSSLEGALMEIGPLRVKQTPPGQPVLLESSDAAWSEYANLLFIDQPAGTGYSYVNNGDDVRELAQAADQVVVFLTNFYKTFPELSSVETYLAGESFAGQYIPYIAQAILDTTTLPTKLMGILMGNAWINPEVQYPAYLEFAYERGLLVKGSSASTRAEKSYEPCKTILESKEKANHVLISECEAILNPILEGGSKTVDGVKMTPISYNITQLSANGETNWPPVLSSLTRYLDQPETAHAFHADSKPGKWTQCNDTIARTMWSPHSVPSYTLLPGLLTKMKVLLYAGDQDFMCNSLGISKSIEQLEWKGQTGFGKTSEGLKVNSSDYVIKGEKVGSWIEARGLSFVVIDKASHLVPIDAPVATLDMLLRFMSVDPLSAAGPSSSIGSSVGKNATLFPLAKMFPNGTLLPTLGSSTKKPSSTDSLSDLLATDSPEVNRDREAYYGPRRTLTLVLVLVGVVVGVSLLLRWRRLHRTKSLKNSMDDPESGRAPQVVRLKSFEQVGVVGRRSQAVQKGEDERLLDDQQVQRVRKEEEVFGIGEDDDDL